MGGDVWSKADLRNNGFVDYSRFVEWIWSDDAPEVVKNEITSWIMDGVGKTKSKLSDWTFHPWIIHQDKDVFTELSLRENGSFEQKTIRLAIKTADEACAAPYCTITGSGTWEVEAGDCILRYTDGRLDGYTMSRLKRLHEENKP